MQQTAIKHGIIAGIATVLYLLVFYYFDRASILNPLVYWSTLVIAGVGMVAAVKKQRSDTGGKIDRQTALKTAFLVFVIAMLIFNLFVFVLFNYVDPGLADLQKQMMEEAGRATKDLDFKMTLGRVMFGYAFSLIGGFFISYLIASILKK
jgi:hypothetical protein